MLVARLHGNTNRHGDEARVRTNEHECSPQCGRENRYRTRNSNSSERRVVMNFGDLLGNLGGIGELFAPFMGIIEAILSLFTGLFSSLGGLGG